MTIKSIIENVTQWAQGQICDKLSFKLPDDERNDNEYPGIMTKPTAFAMFVPAKDRLPPKVRAPIPSLCVQVKEGQDTLNDGKRTLKMRFGLATWNPGEHGTDVYYPFEDNKKGYHRTTNNNESFKYTRNMEGWKDLWNFADKVLKELEGTEYISGLRLVKETDGISYGPYKEDGAIWDYYPYWFLWIDFTLECGVAHRVPENYEQFL